METSLLKTKLGIPPLRPQLIQRDKLVEQFDLCLDYDLTLVSAPAGFGKTTILSQWSHQKISELPIAWLSLDKGDDDPIRFWRYCIGALGASLEVETEELEALLKAPASVTEQDLDSLVTLLINTLLSLRDDFVLILDDYHVIANTLIHQSMIYFLEHMPQSMHLVIATREDPPFPLARFRGKGVLMTITDADLRFDLEDTSKLLDVIQAPTISDDELRVLNERVEGWAVGLKMAGQSLRRQPDVSTFIRNFTGSQEYIMDYLIEEVLQSQSDDTRRFLLTVSILDRLTGPLCDALTGGTDGQERLTSLEKANLFIHKMDEIGQWYRFDHLFADMLQHRLEMEFGLEKRDELHRLASNWYENNGSFEEAIEHALSAKDWGNVIDMYQSEGGVGPGVFGVSTTYNWLRHIPEEILEKRPEVCIWIAWSLIFLGKSKAGEELLDKMEQSKSCDVDMKELILGVRITVAVVQQDPRIEEYAHQISLLQPDNIAARTWSDYCLGWYYTRQRHFNEAEPCINRAFLSYQGKGEVPAAALRWLAYIAFMRGKLLQAEKILQRALHIANRVETRGGICTTLGMIYYQRNDLEVAVAEWEKGCVPFVPPSDQGLARLYLAGTKLIKGDIETAAEAIEKAGNILNTEDISKEDLARISAFHLSLALQENDQGAVTRWTEKLAEYEGPFLYDIPASARHLLFQNMGDAGRAQLQAEYEHLHKEGYRFLEMGVRLEQALLSSDPEEALSFLGEVLRIAKDEGNIRIIADLGQLILPMLREAIVEGIEPEFAGKILKVIEDDAYQRKMKNGEIPPASSLLSDRELEVLRLIESGLSNQQIADNLMISLSTTKTHVHRILEKLKAKDRSQAIYRARELNIL